MINQEITKFNKSTVNATRQEIQAKLDELKELGLDVTLGNISFNHFNFTAKITCQIQGADDEFVTEFKRTTAFLQYPDAIRKTVSLDGEQFIFRGFKPRTKKSRVILEMVGNPNGSLFRCNFSAIESQL